MNLKAIMTSVKDAAVEHSPEILTGLGITGMAITAILAVKATPKVLDILAEVKEEHKNDADKKAYAKDICLKVAPKYTPAVIMFGVSAACLIGSTTVNNKRTAALATAYSLSETALVEYKDKVKEMFGEEKEKEVHNAIVQDHIQRNPAPMVALPSGDDVLCYDVFGDRWFYSTYNKIGQAANAFNKNLLTGFCMYDNLTNFYYELGLSGVRDSDKRYFNVDHLVDVSEPGAGLTDDNRPYLIMEFMDPPKEEYYKV